jgi:hypothetical protein
MALRVDQVERRSTRRIDPREEVDAEPDEVAPRATPAPTESGIIRVGPSRPAPAPAVEAAPVVAGLGPDPRLAELDPLLSRGSWREILVLLGPAGAVEKLPPTLALIHAIAQRESAGDASATPANELAIRSMAAIYGIAPESTTALVLAKRLLRQNPAAWRTKPAPPAKLSALIIAVAVAFGLGVGWWFSAGSHHLF